MHYSYAEDGVMGCSGMVLIGQKKLLTLVGLRKMGDQRRQRPLIHGGNDVETV